jgi:uncharacterized protein (TIGR00725 family)
MGFAMFIAVIGGNDASSEALAAAEEAGREIARGGHVLVCGGLGGIMEAACRGARNEGGHTIGILPGPDRSKANAFVEFPIVTGLGYARNALVVQSADAVIAIEGSYGTLSEIALALGYGRPVVGLGTWRISDAAGVEDRSILRAESAAQAVQLALAAGARVSPRYPQGVPAS